MSCPSELTLSIYVDGELPADEAVQLASHLAACAACRALATQLEQECRVLRGALEAEAMEAAPAAAVAARAPAWPWVAIGAAAAPLLASAALAMVPTLPPSLAWLDDISLTAGLAALLRGLGHAVTGGEQMLTPIVSFAATVAIALLLLSSASMRRRLSAAATRGGAVLLALAVGATSAQAFEHRESEERLVVAADEAVTGSLLLTSMYAVVEGVVDGDVVAFARNITVSGEIKGNLYAAAETVEVTGHIGGSLHAAAQALNLKGQVDGGAYLMGQTISTGADASVGRDLVAAGELVEVAGRVGDSLHFAANNVYVKGAVARDAKGAAQRLVLVKGSSVGGDVEVKVASEEAMEVQAGATIAGQKKVDLEPWQEQERHALLTPGFYLGAVVRVLGSLIVGLLLVLLAPGAVPRVPTGSTAVLKTMGVGFLTLVATPVAIVIAAVTLIGLPLAILAAMAYALCLCFSSLVVAYFLVRALLAPKPGQASRLIGGTAVALFLILVVTELPLAGTGLGFLVVILGLGSLVLHAIGLVRGQPRPA